ncbi:PAAR domain-containing protein [Falsiroseomonas oryzae]|uniref:PAAR domain-containing protein n=1 Tax=Falsiroseomonas oryzae TaxID=2766473 RepID=UPI0022EA1740|nr:PAAR domain-containing protein [Roseomonas sp. MO-31]
MTKPAARVGDQVLQDSPHCHAPIHPPGPVPAPAPHPGMPLAIIPPGAPTVMIGGMPAATVTSQTAPCMMAACVPGGPGMVSVGSGTVMIGSLPAARVGDMTAHTSCVAPIPGPTGKILPPGCPTVMIGG